MGKRNKRKHKGHEVNRPPSDPKKAKPSNETDHNDTECWKTSVKQRYGDPLKRTIFDPPVYMNRQHLVSVNIASVHDVCLNEKPVEYNPEAHPGCLQDSHFREDYTHCRILHCFQALADKYPQTMAVVSQLNFDDYLKYTVKLPRPKDLKLHGDFDILIIHPLYGLLALEVKAAGEKFRDRPTPWTEDEKEIVIFKKIEKAVKQLRKEKKVLKHLVSDKKTPPRIKTALVVPYVKKDQLDRIFQKHQKVREDLCKCLDLQASDDPVEYCFHAGVMTARNNPWDVTDNVMEQLTQWWQRFAQAESSCPMGDDDYLDLVARFCGPATRPSFRVVKPQRHWHEEAVSEIGDKFSRRVLTQDQIDVLKKGWPLSFICGPPGTGKTVVLMLMACEWLVTNPDRDLHIASTWAGSLAASHLIAFELRQQPLGYRNRVHFHEFVLKEDGHMEKAVEILLNSVREDELFLLCDEAFGGREFAEFCTQLNNNCKKLHLWAASVYHGYCPPCLLRKDFTSPLRTPPVITREVMLSDVMKEGVVHRYIDCSAPLPCDGLPILRLNHLEKGHSTSWPGVCEKCGMELGILLKNLIESNQTASNDGPPPLSYQDIFILTTYYEFEDEKRDEDGHIVSSASGLLEGLKQKGVPFRVVRKGDSALAEVAAILGPDAVVVTEADSIRGLERKVVVWVESEMGGNSSGDIDFARLDAMSRTTSQLVIIGSSEK